MWLAKDSKDYGDTSAPKVANLESRIAELESDRDDYQKHNWLGVQENIRLRAVNRELVEAIKFGAKVLDTCRKPETHRESARDLMRQMEEKNLVAVARAQETPAPASDGCKWTQMDYNSGDYDTECDHAWSINDGTPAENSMKFCHGCGKPIIVVSAEEANGGKECHT